MAALQQEIMGNVTPNDFVYQGFMVARVLAVKGFSSSARAFNELCIPKTEYSCRC